MSGLEGRMKISVTERAARELKRIRTENKIPDEAYLRVGLKGGGCSGFTYIMGFTERPLEDDEIFESGGMRILINKRALPYVSGLELDFNEDVLNHKFVFNNPQAERTCGCGESFGVKEDKKNKEASDTGGIGKVISEEAVWKALRECYDPEIPVNIVDLGLIYELEIEGNLIRVKMTLTSPGCGMAQVILNQARMKLLDLPGVVDVDVQLVYDPPWDQSRMSEEAKRILNIN